MYIEVVPNRNSPPAVLLREVRREGKRIRKTTLANLTHWPAQQVAAFRALLRGETLVTVSDLFTVERSLPHGHVRAVLGMIRKLGLAELIDTRPTRQRDLVLAMIAQRVLDPDSKLATTRNWQATTLADDLAVADAEVDELYDALDWLLARQPRIERKLVRRHLTEGALVLYDVSSSCYEGRTCPLVRYGHNRDENDLPIIVYGVLTDRVGRPLALSVYPGNTADPNTVADQVEKLRDQFDLQRVVLIGDRGLLTQTQIENLRQHPGLGWISALRAPQLRELVAGGILQMSLFDEQQLAEIQAPEVYPGERLIACYNPFLAADRGRMREALLAATERDLARIGREVARRTHTVMGRAEIGVKVGKVVNRHKVGKHFTVTIEDGRLSWERKAASIRCEAELDGIYVIRTSEPVAGLTAADVVRNYKNLSQVERAFRTLKGVDLLVAPIYLRLEDHVRAHIFLCFLAYYVEWHMREALAPLLFADEEVAVDRWQRDPVAPAQGSASARKKRAGRQTTDGLAVHSFQTLLKELGTQCRNRCVYKRTGTGKSPAILQVTEATETQRRAFELLGIKCTQ